MRNKQINIRLSETEHEALERACEAAGLNLSEWVRAVVLTAAGVSALAAQLRRVAK